MRLGVPLVCALVLIFGACSAADEGTGTESVTSSTPVSVTDLPAASTTTSSTTTTSITTPASTTTTLVPVAVPMVWQRVPDDGVFTDSSIAVVVGGGPGLVAGGAVFDVDLYRNAGPWGSSRAALWISEDGAVWERIDDSILFADDASDVPSAISGISDIAVGPLGFAAVGSHIWISSDGLSWSRVVDDLEDIGFIHGVTAGGPGWVAVGDSGVDALAWVSSDGLEWTLVEDEDLLAGDMVAAELREVTLGGPGLVAVGSVGVYGGSGDTAQQAAVWISEDGIDWERLPDGTFAGDMVFEGVTSDVASDRIIALGVDKGIWHSFDGQEWIKTEWALPLGGPATSSGVAWDGERLVAGGEDWELSVWASLDDGLTWHRIEPDGVTFAVDDIAHDVVLVGSRFVAVGEAPGLPGEPPRGVVWIGEWTDR